MNQILYVQEKKKNTKLEINKIIRFFCISIIIFGIILTTQGSYALYNNLQNSEEPAVGEANINVTQEESEAIIKVTNNIGIDKIIYNWNNESEKTIAGNNSMNIERTIEIPIGKNTLNLKVYDAKGKCTQYTQEYTLEAIDFVIENNTNTMKIIVRDSKLLSYITYAWNNDDAITVEANGEKTIEEEIKIPVGLNTLRVISVNSDGDTNVKEQEIKGVESTKVAARLEGNYIVITLTDSVGIKTIKHISNDGEAVDIDAGGKTTFEYMQELIPGKNSANLTIINNENITTEQEIICNN